MWKGLKKALVAGRSSKAQKVGPAADVSTRSTSSAGALFQLDMSELDGMVGLQHDKQQQQQHAIAAHAASSTATSLLQPSSLIAAGEGACDSQQQQQEPSAAAAAATSSSTTSSQQQQPAAARTWAQLQAQLQQQFAVQALVQQADDSTHKRRAAAEQKRVSNSMLNPSACLYQISALLCLSTLFEHKLQRDTLHALQQQPSSLRAGASSLSCAACQQPQPQLLESPAQACCCTCQQRPAAPAAGSSLPMASTATVAAPGSSATSSTSAGGGGAACTCGAAAGGLLLRTPSATAASTAHVARQLASWGYRVIVRKVLHSKAYWTKAMDNTFLVVLDSSSGSHVEYIVDPHFREAFNVGVVSSNYSAVWDALPQVFVGMPCQLQSVVQLLCEEVELSFLEAGRPCPPWRGWAATINRWMSDQFVDILVPEPGAPDEEVAEFLARCTQFNAAAASAGAGPSSNASSAAVMASASAAAGPRSGGGGGTCSPGLAGTGASGMQRLGDKVHVSSVLSSSSVSRERHVPEPLHQLVGFGSSGGGGGASTAAAAVGAAARDAAQVQPGDLACSSSSEDDVDDGATVSSSCAGGDGSSDVPPTMHAGEAAADACLRSNSTCSVASSCCSGSSTPTRHQPGGARRSRSLLTAQMQFRQQLEVARQRQHGSHDAPWPAPLLGPGGAGAAVGGAPAAAVAPLADAVQPLAALAAAQPALPPQLLSGQQQEQQALLQQHALAQLQQLQLLQQQQLALQQAAALQQAGLPVVHTVRPWGAQPQQLVQAQGALDASAQQPAAAQQPQTQEEPRLLRLIHRPKPAAAQP